MQNREELATLRLGMNQNYSLWGKFDHGRPFLFLFHSSLYEVHENKS